MILTVVKNMKEVEPEYLLMFKVGNFYYAYGKDSYILSYLFDYKIKMVQNEIPSCGFPKNAIRKVQARLELNKINYMLLDKRNNFDVDEKMDNKNLNEYNEIYDRAKDYIKIRNKIQNLSQQLILQIKTEDIKDKLKRIEGIINEGR